MLMLQRLLRITLCAALLALATPADAARKKGLSSRPADAVEVFRCAFDQSWDVNYDKWPDRWSRAAGPGYPHYVEIDIADDPSTSSGKRLDMRLDGAQAKISSPPIRVLSKFSYYLELKIRREQVTTSRVLVHLDYLNPQGEVRQSVQSQDITINDEWVTVRLGPERPRHNDIDRAVITIETERGKRGDLQGVVSVADMWLGRTPSMDVRADNEFHVYTNPRDVVITCSLSGIREQDPLIRFQLWDATSKEISGAQGQEKLEGRAITEEKLISEESRLASEIVDGVGNHSIGYEGSTEWRPEIQKHGAFGFYQVHVQMLSSKTGELMDHRTITLAVIPPPIKSNESETAGGEFGWTLPGADYPLNFGSLEQMLPLIGVNWVKLPIWFPVDNSTRGEQILQFVERLAASDIETIGVVQHPDHFLPESELGVGEQEIANVFSGDASRWLPMFDHIMSRLSLRIRWWQLGADSDTSFVGYPDLVQKITDIRQQLYRFGQDVGVGLGWRWDTPPMAGGRSWEFQQMSSNPPLTSQQLDARLSEFNSPVGKRWVLINPDIDVTGLLTKKQRHEERVREFIQQIVVAKKHGADGLFVPNPFSGPNGLMTEEGKPGELLLPWRTAATLLSGAEYMGQLTLPQGSSNWLFLRPDGQVVMVLFNDGAKDQPVQETLYLGERIRHIDIWGKDLPTPKQTDRDVVSVSRMPSFVLGLNESVARWRMAVKFEKDRVPSIFGQEHPNALLMRNTFRQGVGGRFKLFVADQLRPGKSSDKWKISMAGEKFAGAIGADISVPMEISLDDATIGMQPVRIDFDIEADRAEQSYRFSVWRKMQVGLGDVRIEVQSELNEKKRLVVTQKMTNTSGKPLSFKCFLHAPERRRKRAQVFELGPEVDTKTYSYPNGEALLNGEIKLRIEELDGPRVLIQRFIAKP